MITAAEFLKWVEVFHVLTSGSIDTGVISWNGFTGIVNATSDNVLLGTQHLFLTNDSGTTDNLSGMPTINAINASIATKLSLSGGTMTGFLTLNADPVSNLEAATKQYVDSVSSSPTFQNVYDNSGSAPSFKVSTDGFSIQDPSNNFLFNISYASSYSMELGSQNGVVLSNITNGGSIKFDGASAINYLPSDLGVNSPNFTFIAQSIIPSNTFATSGSYQFGFSDESSSPSGFFKLILPNSGSYTTLLYGTGIGSGNNLRVGINGQLTLGIPYGTSSDPSAILQLYTSTQGFLLPAGTTTQRNFISSPAKGLQYFNATTSTNDYFDGTDWDQCLALSHVIQGANMTITDNGDGTMTFASSGGGGTGVQVNGAFNVINNLNATIPFFAAFNAVDIDPSTFSTVNQDGVSITMAAIGGVNTPIITNTSTGMRWVKVTFDFSINPTNFVGQQYTFAIQYQINGGALITTNYQANFTVPTITTTGAFKPISLSGLVPLNTNDYVYLAIKASVGSQPVVISNLNGILVDTTVGSIPSTDALTQGTSNLYLTDDGGTTYNYLSGSATVGNYPKFNSTGGQLIDSGIPAIIPSLQTIYDNDPAYPAMEVDLDPVNGEIDFYTSNGAISFDNNGIYLDEGVSFRQGANVNGTYFRLGPGTDDDTSTYVQTVTTVKGTVPFPAMTTAQINAIVMTSAPNGWGAFDTDIKSIRLWDGSLRNPVAIVGGATVSGNTAQFNNTTGKLIDSGYASGNINVSGATVSSTTYYIPFTLSSAGTNQLPYAATDLTYSTNGVSNFLTAPKLNLINLTASQAVVSDGSKNLISLAYTSANTASTLVQRDGSGNFSAGTITANLTGTASTATNANNVATTQVSSNASYYPLMAASSTNSNQAPDLSTGLTYNPSTNILSTTGLNLSGLTASGLVATDSSKNLTSSVSGLSPTFTGLNLSGLTASKGIATDGSKNFISVNLPLEVTTSTFITTSTQSLSLQTRYFVSYASGQMVGTLPSATGTGKVIEVIGFIGASTSGWKVNAQSGDFIYFGSSQSSSGGYILSTSSSASDAITLLDSQTNIWVVYPALGLNITVA